MSTIAERNETRAKSNINVLNNRIDHLSNRVKTEGGSVDQLNRMSHELNALCWMFELVEHIRTELQEHENEVSNLNRKIDHHMKLFAKIKVQYGNPDAVRACQHIIKSTDEVFGKTSEGKIEL